jgi:hypothetical protein
LPVRDRFVGLALFLPVPLVLWLFTRLPLGVGASLAAGVLLVVTHRFYARPFALARAERRCLWCGAATPDGTVVAIEEPLGPTRWRACAGGHADALARVLGFAGRHAVALRIGILGTLALFLPAALLAGASRLGALTVLDATAFFRLGIAVTVLPLGWLGERKGRAPATAARVPFPVHIQALIGTRAVLWLFRLVGLLWFVMGTRHFAARAGLWS